MKNSDKYLPANVVILGLVSLFIIIVLVFSPGFIDPYKTLEELIITGIISLTAVILIRKIKNKILKAMAQTVFVLIFFSSFFRITSDFQLIIYSEWQDNKLLALDKGLFGSETSLLMEQITTLYLTEAMMFAYLFYIPLLVLVAFFSYKEKQEEGLGEYLLILSLGYFFCYIGFILFPVASQMYFNPKQYSVPLTGGVFSYLGELLRNEVHFPGGSLPSPHCTAATIMLFILWKHKRSMFYLFLPSILLLYASTVYCRFHYMWDGVAGIFLALILIKTMPAFQKVINLIVTFYESIMHPLTISDSLSDNNFL